MFCFRSARSTISWASVVVAAVIAIVLLLPAVAGAQTSEPTMTSAAPATSLLVDHAKKISLPGRAGTEMGGPWDVAATNNAVWVLSPLAAEVVRLDPRTNRIAARVKLPAPGCDPASCRVPDHIVATARDVWIVNNSTGTLVHVDARRNKVAGTFAVTPGVFGQALPDASGVWITPEVSVGDVVHVDARTHKVTDTVHVGVAPVGPAAIVDGTLWVGGVVNHPEASPDETLYQVDLKTNTVVGTLPGAAGLGVRVGDELWLNRFSFGALFTAVDGHTGAHRRDVLLDGVAGFQSAGGGSVWVRLFRPGGTQWIIQLDPATGSTVRYDLPASNHLGGLAFSHRSLWVTDWDANSVYRMPVPVR
jgi:hypothetical protein